MNLLNNKIAFVLVIFLCASIAISASANKTSALDEFDCIMMGDMQMALGISQKLEWDKNILTLKEVAQPLQTKMNLISSMNEIKPNLLACKLLQPSELEDFNSVSLQLQRLYDQAVQFAQVLAARHNDAR